MKRYLLFFLFVLTCFLGVFAQNSAYVTWPTNSSVVTGTTSGLVIAGNEKLVGLSFGAPAYSVIGTLSMQRCQMTSGWNVDMTAKLSTVYVEYKVTPKVGNSFSIDSIALNIGAKSTTNLKAEIFYSTDPTFTTSSQITYDTKITGNYISSAAPQRIKAASLGLTIKSGDTLYLRIYPWVEKFTAVTTGKYLCLENVQIGGTTEPVPVASSAVWPCVTDLSSVVTGNVLAGTPTFSNMSVYGYNQTYDGIKRASIWTGAVWPYSETAPQENRYMEFSAFPKKGGTLVADSITLKMAAWSSNAFKVSIYYSTNRYFTLTTGTLLAQDIAVSSGLWSKTLAPLNLSVNSGDSIYFRLYPYYTDATGDKYKLLALSDVSLYGLVSGVSADPPTITTTAVTSISTTFATSGGNISSDGGATVTERGIAWGTTTLPTIENNKLIIGSGAGSFSGQVTGLTPGVTYFFRAYANNSTDIAYGSEVSFTTLTELEVPTVSTTTSSSVMVKTAKSGGNVTAWGGSDVTEKGICWSTSTEPKITDNKTSNGIGTGSFTSILYPLTENTKYFIRAFATNSTGTGYGNEISFTTQIIAPDVTKIVDKNGTGDYTTVQAAFDAVTDNYTGRWMIYVKPGTYYEKLKLAANKVNVILFGKDPDQVILSYDDYADKTGVGGTMYSYSTAIDADDFAALNITFQNTVKNTSSSGMQAVALRSNGDRQIFYNCKLLGYQDTYYAQGGSYIGRVFMRKTLIRGSVDFIFGRDVCIFDSCILNINRNGGSLTAPSTEATSSFGLVFMNDSIVADAIAWDGVTPITNFYLGRAWQAAPRCAYINSYEPATLAPSGWTDMSVNPKLFAEYKCTGDGFLPDSRSKLVASMGSQLTDNDALNYTIPNIFAKTTDASFGYDWIPVIPVVTIPAENVTKVNNNKQMSSILIYPNPASEKVTIQRPDSKIANLAIYNSIGSKVMTKTLQSETEVLDISNLATGIYIIAIDGEKYKLVVK